MTAPHSQEIISRYLARLDQELDSLTPLEKSEVIAQIEGHISEARSALTDETDADLLNILDRLGSPEAVAQSARNTRPEPAIRVAPARVPMTRERLLIAAAILAWAGGLASGVGAFLLFSESDFEPASFFSLFAGICGVAAGIVALRRPAVAVVGVFIAAVVEGANIFRLNALPSSFNTIVNVALVLLIAGGALAGVATILPRSRQDRSWSDFK
jgi:uncharacterized membrane protein